MRTPCPITTTLLFLFAGCSEMSPMARSEAEANRGNYDDAYYALDDARRMQQASGSVDPDLEAAWQAARERYLIEQGRRLIFLEREEQALVDLQTVLARRPDHPEALELVDRARQKIAERATRIGDVHFDKRELPEALASYLDALQVVPGWPRAVEGSQKVRDAFDQMAVRAQKQFLEAIRKLPQSRFVEVNWHAGAAIESDPSRDDAREVRGKAVRELAEQAMERAAAAEARGLYGAALVEYRGAKVLAPDRKGVDDLIAHMEREVRAQQLIEAAAMHLRNDRFAKAKEALDEAFALSVLERGTISELLLQSRQRQGMIAYEAGRDLELQGRKEAALAAFEALAAQWPDGLADEKTRIGALRNDIDAAAREWAAGEDAEQKGDLPAAIEHFEAVEIYYPGWKDTKARIAALKARQTAGGG